MRVASSFSVSLVAATVVAILAGPAVAQEGRVVRPKDAVEETVTEPIVARVCPTEEWDMVKSIRPYNNWTLDTLPTANGFTVMLVQSATTVSSRCFATTLHRTEDGGSLRITNVYPTQPAASQTFQVAPPNASVASDAVTVATPAATTTLAADDAAASSNQLMIAGASRNFVAYATCNGNSSHVNLLVTYTAEITEEERRAVNRWIKASRLPVLGSWAAINFDTCSLTKTYVCKGGRAAFCSSVTGGSKKKKQSSKPESRSSTSSSEESDEEDYDEAIIFVPF